MLNIAKEENKESSRVCQREDFENSALAMDAPGILGASRHSGKEDMVGATQGVWPHTRPLRGLPPEHLSFQSDQAWHFECVLFNGLRFEVIVQLR